MQSSSFDSTGGLGFGDARERMAIGIAMSERREPLAADIAAALSATNPARLEAPAWRSIADFLLQLLATAIERRDLTSQADPTERLVGITSGVLSTRELFAAVFGAERAVLDELALHETLGATSEPWPIVAHVVRSASFEVAAALASAMPQPAEGGVRDPLTTLLTRAVFDEILAIEVDRSARHSHPLGLILMDVDNLAAINAEHGVRVGDRLLERMGILVRRFFRQHDLVARHGGDSIVALLPETSLDLAVDLATRVCSTVEQRLRFVGQKSDERVAISVSAAVAGAEMVEPNTDPAWVLAQGEAALLRAKTRRHGVERVVLRAESLSLIGAAKMLGCALIVVRRLVREKRLPVARHGRHYQIERSALEMVKVRIGKFGSLKSGD